MPRLLADENFHGDIVRGLLRRDSALDIVRVQDTDLYQANDPAVLEWAAHENRILLTHDVQTMTKHAYARVQAGLPMFGVIVVRDDLPVGQAIEELFVVLLASSAEEHVNRIIFISL